MRKDGVSDMKGSERRASGLAALRAIQPFQQVENPFIAGMTEDYLAVFKPAGMHSVRVLARIGSDTSLDETPNLIAWLEREVPDHCMRFRIPGAKDENENLESEEGRIAPARRRAAIELGMLSRLDRDTSGLILFARSIAAMRRALEIQRSGGMRKFYRLVAAPNDIVLPGFRPRHRPLPAYETALFLESATLGGGLAIESHFRSYGEKGAMVACVSRDEAEHEKKPLSKEIFRTVASRRGQPAIEEFARAGSAMEIDAMIVSGFRHQIRAHMAWIGYPIAGDRLYGGMQASRLFLECHRVEIVVSDAQPMAFELYEGEQN